MTTLILLFIFAFPGEPGYPHPLPDPSQPAPYPAPYPSPYPSSTLEVTRS